MISLPASLIGGAELFLLLVHNVAAFIHPFIRLAAHFIRASSDKIAAFSIDGAGKLSKEGETPAEAGPSVMAVSPDRRLLYVGQRAGPAINAFRIDPTHSARPLAR